MYTSCDPDKILKMSLNMLNRSHAGGYIHDMFTLLLAIPQPRGKGLYLTHHCKLDSNKNRAVVGPNMRPTTLSNNTADKHNIISKILKFVWVVNRSNR